MKKSAADLASLATGGGPDNGVVRFRPFPRHRLPDDYKAVLYGDAWLGYEAAWDDALGENTFWLEAVGGWDV